jgi:hypothetical protein
MDSSRIRLHHVAAAMRSVVGAELAVMRKDLAELNMDRITVAIRNRTTHPTMRLRTDNSHRLPTGPEVQPLTAVRLYRRVTTTPTMLHKAAIRRSPQPISNPQRTMPALNVRRTRRPTIRQRLSTLLSHGTSRARHMRMLAEVVVAVMLEVTEVVTEMILALPHYVWAMTRAQLIPLKRATATASSIHLPTTLLRDTLLLTQVTLLPFLLTLAQHPQRPHTHIARTTGAVAATGSLGTPEVEVATTATVTTSFVTKASGHSITKTTMLRSLMQLLARRRSARPTLLA